MYQRISAEEYETIISAIKNEVEFIRNNYEVPLNILDSWVDKLFSVDYICDSNEVTTPFSDDLGNENNYQYLRELGEVHDTFNVEIRQGNGSNPITLTRQVIRCSQDDGSYLQSMVDVLSKLRN